MTVHSHTAQSGTSLLQIVTRPLLVDLRWASQMAIPRSIVSRYATAWAESLEGALTGHQSWAILCRYRCRLLLVEVPKGSDNDCSSGRRETLTTSSEELEGSSTLDSKAGQRKICSRSTQDLKSEERKTGQPQTEEQRSKKSVPSQPEESIGKAVERTRGWSSSGFSRTSEALDRGLVSTELWPR